MERQSDIVFKTLKIMSKAGVLDNVLLIGSWCSYFYKQYFSKVEYNPVIRTRDIDFLVNVKPKFPKSVDLEELLKPIGFEIEFFGKGYMKLESEELAIEFIVPEIGRPNEKPLPLPSLKLNAQPLRHISILWRNPIKVKISGISIYMPHPVDYLLQKFIIAGKRNKFDKALKDRQSAQAVLAAIIESNELSELKQSINTLSKKELKMVTKEFERAGQEKLLLKL